MLDLLDSLLSDLFRCLSPTSINQSDIFRCWGCLISVFAPQVLDFIVKRLDTLPGSAVVRVKALRVLQYLVNYETLHIEDNKILVLKALLPLQATTNVNVRLQLLHVTQALLSNQLLFNKNNLHEVHGGRQLIEFIVRMAALNPKTGKDQLKVQCSQKHFCALTSG